MILGQICGIHGRTRDMVHYTNLKNGNVVTFTGHEMVIPVKVTAQSEDE